MGSDTCGSIRNPASHNNLVGLRGTQGLSSRTGIVPLSSTQDIGGPIARTHHRSGASCSTRPSAPIRPMPSTAASAGHIPASYRAGLRADAIKGARIGVVRSLFGTAPEDQEVDDSRQSRARRTEEGRRRRHRRRRSRPRRSAARQLDDQLRLQVRSRRLSRPRRSRAGEVARRDSRPRPVSHGARGDVPAAQRRRAA